MIKYILLIITFSVFGMFEEKNSPPALSKLESLKEYTLTESYKGVASTTSAVALFCIRNEKIS